MNNTNVPNMDNVSSSTPPLLENEQWKSYRRSNSSENISDMTHNKYMLASLKAFVHNRLSITTGNSVNFSKNNEKNRKHSRYGTLERHRGNPKKAMPSAVSAAEFKVLVDNTIRQRETPAQKFIAPEKATDFRKNTMSEAQENPKYGITSRDSTVVSTSKIPRSISRK
jgi:hypothetical protein